MTFNSNRFAQGYHDAIYGFQSRLDDDPDYQAGYERAKDSLARGGFVKLGPNGAYVTKPKEPK